VTKVLLDLASTGVSQFVVQQLWSAQLASEFVKFSFG